MADVAGIRLTNDASFERMDLWTCRVPFSYGVVKDVGELTVTPDNPVNTVGAVLAEVVTRWPDFSVREARIDFVAYLAAGPDTEALFTVETPTGGPVIIDGAVTFTNTSQLDARGYETPRDGRVVMSGVSTMEGEGEVDVGGFVDGKTTFSGVSTMRAGGERVSQGTTPVTRIKGSRELETRITGSRELETVFDGFRDPAIVGTTVTPLSATITAVSTTWRLPEEGNNIWAHTIELREPSLGHFYFWITIGFSNPATSERYYTLQNDLLLNSRFLPLMVQQPGSDVILYDTLQKGATHVGNLPGNGYILIPAGNPIFDGQAIQWYGVVHQPLASLNALQAASAQAAREARPQACATNWVSSGAFGPQAVVPPLPAFFNVATARQHIRDQVAALSVPNNVRCPSIGNAFYGGLQGFNHPQGLAYTQPRSCSTWPGMARKTDDGGDNGDFSSILPVWPGALLGDPRYITLHQDFARQELGLRPIHLKENNALDPVAEPWRHARYNVVPNVVYWSEGAPRADWSSPTAIARMGNKPNIDFDSDEFKIKGRYWWPVKSSHQSIGHAIGTLILSGDRGLEFLANAWAEAWLAAFWIETPYFFGDSPLIFFSPGNYQQTRGEARLLQSGTFLWLALGRQDIRDRLEARCNIIIPRVWEGAIHPNAIVKPARANRDQPVGQPFVVSGWQESMMVHGLMSVWGLFGNVSALVMARRIGNSAIRYSFENVRIPGWWDFAHFHQWTAPDGLPVDPLLGPPVWTPATGFAIAQEWGRAVVTYMRNDLLNPDDPVYNPGGVGRARAEAIYQSWLVNNARPVVGTTFDRWAAWAYVMPLP